MSNGIASDMSTAIGWSTTSGESTILLASGTLKSAQDWRNRTRKGSGSTAVAKAWSFLQNGSAFPLEAWRTVVQ